MKIGNYTDDEILEFMTEGEGRGFLGRSMFDAMYFEIERLKEENKKYNKWVESLNKDNHRLNNIINELEKWLEERLEKLDINGYDDDIFNGIELALQKLKELKGENNV